MTEQHRAFVFVLDPTVEQADVDALRAVGLTDADVADLVFAVAARAFFTKVLDGLKQAEQRTQQAVEAQQQALLDARQAATAAQKPQTRQPIKGLRQ